MAHTVIPPPSTIRFVTNSQLPNGQKSMSLPMNLSISLSPEPWREQKRARRYTECCHDPTIDSSVRKCFLNIHSGWRWSSKKQERKTTRYTRTQTWSQNMPFFRVFPNNLSRYTYYSDMGWSSYIMILVT